MRFQINNLLLSLYMSFPDQLKEKFHQKMHLYFCIGFTEQSLTIKHYVHCFHISFII